MRLASDSIRSHDALAHENKRIIWPEPDREDAFTEASGGGKGTGYEPSQPVRSEVLIGISRLLKNSSILVL